MPASRPQTRTKRCDVGIDTADPALPVAGTGSLRGIRPSRRAPRRAAVLIAVHVVFAAHLAHYLLAGKTLSPVEPSESMYALELGQLNAGFVFFAVALLSTLVFGRFFCGWGCHIVAIQDFCGWLMKRLGVRPRPFRSRLLVYGPLVLALYMFVWPTLKRMVGAAPAFPGFSNHLITSGFWDTFPGPTFAVLTFATCGFAAVYLLGAKGFCTYGCPYGAFFAPLDRWAAGRILVTDACDQCGHCTATCTSNVRVHEEVRDHGMVVDPGCMKCTDCVSVCPKGALYFGFTTAGVRARGASMLQRLRSPFGRRTGAATRRYDFTLGEELALAAICLAATLTFRGLYDGPPLLMSLALGAITAFVALKLWRLGRDRDVRVQDRLLKVRGAMRPGGWVFAALAAAWLLFGAHSAFAQWHRAWGTHHLERTQADRGQVLAGTFRPDAAPTAQRRDSDRALHHLELADRWGLVDVLDVKLGLAWAQLLHGDAAAAEATIRQAISIAPDSPQQHDNLVEFLLARGRVADATEALERKLQQVEPTAEDRFRLGTLLVQVGRAGEAVEAFQASIAMAPRAVASRYNLGGLLRRMGRPAEAADQLDVAATLDPGDPDTWTELGLARMEAGDPAGAIEALRRAVELAPGRPESRLQIAPLIERLEASIGAESPR